MELIVRIQIEGRKPASAASRDGINTQRQLPAHGRFNHHWGQDLFVAEPPVLVGGEVQIDAIEQQP